VSRLSRFVQALENAATVAEDTVLVLILTCMIFLAAGQIVLRNLFNIGFFWSDELLRLMVLWLAVAGAVAASRIDKHISIAVLDKLLPPAPRLAAKLITELFTAVVCAMITWHAIRFVHTTYEFGDTVLRNVPAWIAQIILPIGFGLIAYRYFLFSLKHLFQLASGKSMS
jgi:TRAP-type C4-dicarboxylate transport system permease small subunit